MLPIFTKPLESLTKADLDELVQEQYPEGSTVEFKRELPAKAGKPDPWMLGEGKISDYARNKLLEEIVAFANSHGGCLFVGIEETSTKPAGANAIMPIPGAADLAERIRYQARDCIEPKLPLFHSTAIKTDDAGNGVVVIRVPTSRAAPHRHPDLNCYTRRSDRSEKMTMREIQDLTLRVERGLASIDSAFIKRAQSFAARTPTDVPIHHQKLGIRATAVPLSELYLKDVYQREPGFPIPNQQLIKIDGAQRELTLPRTPHEKRPQLRGMKKHYEDERHFHTQEVFQDGLIDHTLLFKRENEDAHVRVVYIGWVLALVLCMLKNVERFRQYAGGPDVEYGLEVEILGTPRLATLVGFDSAFGRDTLGALPTARMVFPRYSIGPATEFPDTLSLILTDCMESVGDRVSFEAIEIVS